MRIFMEESDEEHYITANTIIKKLESYGVSASRKGIYDDIDVLIRFGLDIIKADGNRGWYLGERDFELAELKLLIDAVKIAKFIPSKNTETLVGKLENLTSKALAKQLNRQVIVNNLKSNNKTIYYSIDAIHNSINEDKKIQFQYGEWTEKKSYRLRKDGKFYVVSPWGVLWNKENYYLLAYDDEISGIKHYRIDHIKNVNILEKTKRNGREYYEHYKRNFTSKTFGMYAGKDVSVQLKCKNSMANTIIDQFGEDVWFMSEGTEHFKVNVLVSISPVFFGWLTSFGTNIEIIYPEEVKKEYVDYLKETLKQYEI